MHIVPVSSNPVTDIQASSDCIEQLPVSFKVPVVENSSLNCNNSIESIVASSLIKEEIPIESSISSVCALANPVSKPVCLGVSSGNTVAFGGTEPSISGEGTVMEKKKQAAKKRKAQVQEQDDSKNDSILEEVLSIAGKKEAKQARESADPPPAKLKKATNGKTVPSIEISDPSSSAAEDINTLDVENEEESPQGLPKGWKRKAVVRKSGKTAGQIDVYFYSPDGTKLRSKPDVSSYLTKNKLNLKIEDFDFSKKAAARKPPVVASSKKDADKDDVSSNKRGKSSRKEIKSKSAEDGVGNKIPPKVVPAKKQAAKSTPRKSTKVPQPTVTEKNNSPVKADKIVVQILASKKKRSRK